MSTIAIAGLSATLGFLLGAATTRPALRRLRRQLAAAVHQAHHDPLTGLPNRTCATELFTRFAEAGRSLTVTLIDLNDFKAVNDTYGHDAGDALLVAVADRLSRTAAHHGGVAARLAGDEFLLLLPTDDHDHLHPPAAALVALTPPVTVTGADGTRATLTPHASAGVTYFNGLDGTLAGHLRQADIALYHAKQRRDHIANYHLGMHMPPPVQRRRRLRDHPAHRTVTRRQVQS
ncbi:GGDEF domain-containing protein [Micromonospora sp. 4G57]|uniref:GGDEF domain-containing protein n=1 Tax=Micromonospora sicca TaxID=2202420 RepID=A0ABU5JP21_9ACTN|nr:MULTISPECIES: GGDEF domain-containing protein [unclassified Micromonospora]MDZ5447658.1 GGDEF domain-containing protein [Micromonospora sp. 4G57]MDZ5494382.1 GGDEF domain-containing protein [Micromonospora sp. 4G53]